MDDLLRYLLYFTLVLSGLLVFKSLFKNRLSARVQLWLWVLLFTYLLIPLMPESAASVYNLLPTETTPAIVASESWESSFTVEPQNPARQEFVAVDHQEMIQEVLPLILLGIVWLFGVLFLLLYFGAVYFHCLYHLKQLPVVDDEELLKTFDAVKERMGIHRRVRLLEGGETPMLVGIIRPAILLPKGYSKEEQEAVLAHELSHLKHKDLVLLWGALLMLILHWYHPLAWVAHRCFRRDVETCCDARVVKLLQNKKEYASLLLSTALRKNRFVAGTTALQNGEKEVSRRIRYLANFKKPSVWGGAGILCIGLLVCVLLLTQGYKSYTMDGHQLGDFVLETSLDPMAEIVFADGDTAVFHWHEGLFVYDIHKGQITLAIDLRKMNVVPQNWNEASLKVLVSDNGKTALLVNENSENLPELSNYRVSLTNGRAYKTKATTLKNPFRGQTDLTIMTGRYSPNGRYSPSMIDTKDGYWFLLQEGGRRGQLQLCQIKRDNIYSSVYVFGNYSPSVHTDALYESGDYQKLLIGTGKNIIPNASMAWTFAIDNGYEFRELEYLADYVSHGQFNLHAALVEKGITPSDYYGKAIHVRIDVLENEDGTGEPHLFVILPYEKVILSQALTHEQEGIVKWLCIYASELQPKGGALEPVSALYTLTKHELYNHFRVTNEQGYVFRSAEIDDWIEKEWRDRFRSGAFTLTVLYEKELDNADNPIQKTYEMRVECDGEVVRLKRNDNGVWRHIALSDFYPLRS